MKRPINESVRFALVQSGILRPAFNRLALTEHLVQVLSDTLSERESSDQQLIEDQKKILELIAANEWERGPEKFFKSISSSKHSLALTPYSVEDYKKMDTYKVPGFNAGFALKDHDGSEEGGSGHNGRVEIVAVHNNTKVRGIGQALMKAAVDHGGRVLDHFDGPLSGIYQKAGFETYKSDPYNPDYDAGGAFKKRYGEQAVHYRRYTGNQNQDGV